MLQSGTGFSVLLSDNGWRQSSWMKALPWSFPHSGYLLESTLSLWQTRSLSRNSPEAVPRRTQYPPLPWESSIAITAGVTADHLIHQRAERKIQKCHEIMARDSRPGVLPLPPALFADLAAPEGGESWGPRSSGPCRPYPWAPSQAQGRASLASSAKGTS